MGGVCISPSVVDEVGAEVNLVDIRNDSPGHKGNILIPKRPK